MQPRLCNFFHQQKCNISGFLFIVGFLSVLVANVQCDDYLKEKPSFLMPCSLSDPKNVACLAKVIESVFTNWKDGIPGLKNLSGMDPLRVKKVHIEQNNHNINLKLDLKDIVITGFSELKIIKANVNGEYDFKIALKIPTLRTKANYRMKGNILVLNLNSAGSMESEISDVDAIYSMTTKLHTINNHRFFDVMSLKTSIKNIGNFSIYFGNLFNSSVELGESANAVFNQNWREIFELMRPALEETLSTVAFKRNKKIFNYIPATYLIADVL